MAHFIFRSPPRDSGPPRAHTHARRTAARASRLPTEPNAPGRTIEVQAQPYLIETDELEDY